MHHTTTRREMRHADYAAVYELACSQVIPFFNTHRVLEPSWFAVTMGPTPGTLAGIAQFSDDGLAPHRADMMGFVRSVLDGSLELDLAAADAAVQAAPHPPDVVLQVTSAWLEPAGEGSADGAATTPVALIVLHARFGTSVQILPIDATTGLTEQPYDPAGLDLRGPYQAATPLAESDRGSQH